MKAKEEKNWESKEKSLKDHRLGNALPSPKEKAKPKPKAKSEAKDAQDSAPVLPDKKKPKEKAKPRGRPPYIYISPDYRPPVTRWNEKHFMSVSFISWEVHELLRLQVRSSEEYLHTRMEEEVGGRSQTQQLTRRGTPQERRRLLLLEEGDMIEGPGKHCKFKHPQNSSTGREGFRR